MANYSLAASGVLSPILMQIEECKLQSANLKSPISNLH